MDNKTNYINFYKTEEEIPVFSSHWWLDSVCGKDGWCVALVTRDGKIVASMPYHLKKIKGFSQIVMPMLTQTMGPYIKYPADQKYESRLSYEKEIMSELIDQLPKFDSFRQNFHYSITNWLPFYWKDFTQTTRYTYVIDDLKNLNEVWGKFSYAKRKNIKKADQIVNVQFDLSAKDFYENHQFTLAKQGEKIKYTFNLFENIYAAGYKNKSAKTIYATDKEGNIHAALFVIWNSQSAYNLISTIDPDFRNSGAASLLVKEIIKYVSNYTNRFDFEGSMIEGVENSFRQFGAIQKPYFAISKTASRILKIGQALEMIIRAIMNK